MKTFTRILCVALVLMLLSTTALAEGAKKYIVGTNAEFPPFESIAADGTFVGFDMALISEVLTRAGVEFEIQTMDFTALLPALASSKIDIAIAAMTITDERKQNALFSDSYFHATQSILVKADSTIAAEADLAGKTVGVQMGTTGDIYMSGSKLGVTVERYTKALDAVMDLAAGRLDAVVVDEGPSQTYAASVEGLKVLDVKLSDEEYGIAMALGQDEFMAKINEQLAAIKADGTYDKLYAKYFGEPGATTAN